MTRNSRKVRNKRHRKREDAGGEIRLRSKGGEHTTVTRTREEEQEHHE